MSLNSTAGSETAPVDFDHYAQSYSDHLAQAIRFSGRSHRFFVQAKVDHLIASLNALGIAPATATCLDVGCGTGETAALLSEHVGELFGVDISKESVALARQRPETRRVRYSTYDGVRLPYESGQFDFAFAVAVVHHVPPANWLAFVSEMARVVRPGGFVAIYEHNPWNPLTRRVVSNCEFDRDAVLLSARQAGSLLERAGLSTALKHHILFFPWKNRFVAGAERLLRRVPFGAQYAVYGRVSETP